MKAQDLKNSILQLAIQGKLVPQDANDEPASVLLEKIKAEKTQLIKEGKIKKDKNESFIIKTEDGHYIEKFSNGTEVDITEEIPFDVPESWCWCRLDSITEIISDGTHKTPKYKEVGIPFLSVQNISKGYFDLSKIKYISEKEHNELIKRVAPKRNDILFCRVGTLGKAIKNILNFEFSIFVSLGIIRLIDLNLVDYLICFINSPIGYRWILENRVGGGTHTFKLNLEDIKKMIVPLPPLAEQQRIVDKIEELEPLIKEYDEQEQQLSSLNETFPDKIKKSILQYAIQGKLIPQDANDEPASVLLEKIKAEKVQLIKEGKVKKDKQESFIEKTADGKYVEHIGKKIKDITDEIPFEIPSSWEWVRLNQIGKLCGGKTPKENEISSIGVIPYYKVSDMNVVGNEVYMDISKNYLNSDRYEIFPEKSIIFPKNGGAVFTNKKRILRKMSLVDLNTGVFSLYYVKCLSYIFLNFIIIDFRKIFKGTALPTIDADKLKNYLIPLPPLAEQERIVDKIESLFKLCEEL